MTVTIPACEQHGGFYSMTVTISDYCPKCGSKRGVPYKGCRCSQYCSVWNSEDRDCEIMGSYHLSPSRCRWFLMQELKREESE